VGFHLDDEGHWVAELSCLHNQHVRHRPPFENRPWVLSDETRGARIGSPLECPLCAAGELPGGLRTIRTAGPFDETNVPVGLLGVHKIAEGRWGLLRVVDGAARLVFDGYSTEIRLRTGEMRGLPPNMAHHLELEAHARFEIDFLIPGGFADDPSVTA
jgi:tellurite methyltransferase